MLNVRTLLCAATVAFTLQAQDGGPSHVVVTHRVYPEKRNQMRNGLLTQSNRLGHWRDDGFITGFQVLTSSLADDEGWEAMLIAKTGTRGLELFKRLEPIDSAASSTTVPVDLVKAEGETDVITNTGVFLIVPLDCERRGAPANLQLLRDAMQGGGLIGYRYFSARYPSGRSWNGLYVLHFADWAALGNRAAWPEGQTGCRERVAVIAEALAGK